MYIFNKDNGAFICRYQGPNIEEYARQFGDTYIHQQSLDVPKFWQYVNGQLQRTPTWETDKLAMDKEAERLQKLGRQVEVDNLMASALSDIDTEAEQQRAPFITQGDGQALSYQRKAEQALACLADPAPVIENYPWLKGDLVATGLTLQEVAQRVIDTRTGFDAIGALIEEIRLVAKDKVRTIAADETLDIDEKLSAMHQASEVDWSPIDTLEASWNT